MKKWENEVEELNRLINIEKVSYEEIGRRYNCSGSNIKKIAKKYKINLPKRRKINPCETFNKGKTSLSICLNCGKEYKSWNDGKENHNFCSLKCFSEYKHNKNYKEFLKGKDYFMRANWSPKLFKKDIISEQKEVCAICGCKQEHNGKPLVFILDHIDGNASNNSRSNLRAICPNCDSQLDTYKSKNKNSARHKFRYG